MTTIGIDAAFKGALGAFTLDAAFTAPTSGVTALFGPSGCGKTTILRCIAGLARLASGYCEVGGEIWQSGAVFRPPHHRAVGYVFQEASLFPHLSVRGNLAYGQRPGAVRFDEMVELLALEPLLERAPARLSGGERQRVAIARALLSQPAIMLLDEPLSALDHAAKQEILPYIERVRAALAIPVIYVSHDMGEVERIADHLVLMTSGRILACGLLSELRSDPTLPLIHDRRAGVILEGTVLDYDPIDGLSRVSVKGASLVATTAALRKGDRVRVRVRAREVSLTRDPWARSSILNVVPTRILSLSPAADHGVTVLMALGEEGGGDRLIARISRWSSEYLELKEGEAIHALIKGLSIR